MTHNQWEQGKRLTIHNATKEQLKFMVRERESMIQDLTKQLDEKQLRRKINARTNASSKRDRDLTRQLDEKQKALEDAIKMLKDMI